MSDADPVRPDRESVSPPSPRRGVLRLLAVALLGVGLLALILVLPRLGGDPELALEQTLEPIRAQLAEQAQRDQPDEEVMAGLRARLEELHLAYPEHNPTRTLHVQVQIAHRQRQLLDLIQAKGDTAAVRVAVRDLAALGPEIPEAQVLWGQTLLLEKKHDAARSAFDAALALRPGDAELTALVGSLWMEAEQFGEAVAMYRQTLARKADRPGTRTLLGVALERAGQPDEAKAQLNQAVQDDGSDHRAYAALAQLAMQAGDTAESDQLYGLAILWAEQDDEVDPSGYRRGRIGAMIDDGRLRDAWARVRALEPSARFTPETADLVGAIARGLNQPMLGALYHDAYAVHDPANPAVVTEAAVHALRANQPALARRHLDTLQTLAPNHPELSMLWRRLSQMQGTPGR